MKPGIINICCFLLVFASGNSIILSQSKYIRNSGNTISERFIPPKGFVRINPQISSFAYYLQNLKLKPHGSSVKYYDGRTKNTTTVYIAVVDMEIGNQNLQQCADAVIRLKAEYLFHQKLYEKIHFNFTNGFTADYLKWRDGYRIVVSGNKCRWDKKTSPSSDYKVFRKYLDMVFMYAGSLSLSQELKPVKYSQMQIGDVLIKGGSPGHAVIIVDMAINPQTNEKVYLLAQSYMPAQDIQVLLNPMQSDNSPWYKIEPSDTPIITPEWTFKASDLKRFTN